MPFETALARNPNVRNEELRAAIEYFTTKIRLTVDAGHPFPFNAYRSKILFEKALRIRTVETINTPVTP